MSLKEGILILSELVPHGRIEARLREGALVDCPTLTSLAGDLRMSTTTSYQP